VRKKKIEVQSQQNLDEPSIALLLVSWMQSAPDWLVARDMDHCQATGRLRLSDQGLIPNEFYYSLKKKGLECLK
jgi:hypothetical protein